METKFNERGFEAMEDINMSMNISSAYIMRSAYSGYLDLKDDAGRKQATKHELVDADRRAMVRALDRIDELDYDNTDSTNTKNIYNMVTSYIDIYNYAVTSAGDSDSNDIRRTAEKMKKFTKEYADELEDLGITMKSDGSLKVDTKELKKATTKAVKKIFSGDSDYVTGMKSLMKKLRNHVNREPANDLGMDSQSSLNLLV